jgi:hypothetical protein
MNLNYSGDPKTGHLNSGYICKANKLGSGYGMAIAIPKWDKSSGFEWLTAIMFFNH